MKEPVVLLHQRRTGVLAHIEWVTVMLREHVEWDLERALQRKWGGVDHVIFMW